MAGRHPSYGHHGYNEQVTNEERLRAYEAVQNLDSRNNLQYEKLDLAQQKAAFDQAQKTADAEQRAKAFEQKSSIQEERLKSMEALREAEIASRQAKEEQDTLKALHTAQVATAAANTFKAIGQLDRKDPQFIPKLYGVLAENPDAANHPAVLAAVKHEQDVYDRRAELQAKTQANPTQAFQDALAASQPLYGVADKNNNFTATTAGQSDQTHVQTTYRTPSGKIVTEVFPRSVFDGAVSASKGRQTTQSNEAASGDMGAAPAGALPSTPATPLPNGLTPVPDANVPQGTPAQVPPTPTGVPAPTGATTPAPQISPEDQAAISWAQSNPNDPRAAKIKQLHGIQ